MIKKYVRRDEPEKIIEAIQVNYENFSLVKDYLPWQFLLLDDFGFRIETFDGYLLFRNNAYLIKGADGDWYPKGELTFNARYKEVKE